MQKVVNIVVKVILIVYILLVFWGAFKPNPDNISMKSNEYTVNGMEFLVDINTNDGINREVYNKVYNIIDRAKEFLVIDMNVINDYKSKNSKNNITNLLSSKLVDKIIKEKSRNRFLKIIILEDHLNNTYDSYESKILEKLQNNNIKIIFVNTDKIKDNNYLYSGLYNMFFRWLPNSSKGNVSNYYSKYPEKVNVLNALKLMNFKKNNRKIIVSEKEAMLMSNNPTDNNGNISTIGFYFKGDIIKEIVKSEEAVVNINKDTLDIKLDEYKFYTPQSSTVCKVNLLTESKYKDELLVELKHTKKGDSIYIMTDIISDRKLVKILMDKINDGVKCNFILSPNYDKFKQDSKTLPNRQVVYEIRRATKDHKNNMNVRWYDEKDIVLGVNLIKINKKDEDIIFTGSSTFSRRNLNNSNLNSNLKIVSNKNSNLNKEVDMFLDNIRNNSKLKYTVDEIEHEDSNIYRWTKYFIVEILGMNNF